MDRSIRRFLTIPQWCAYSQMSRTRTYIAVGRGELKAAKMGSRTLIDAEDGDRYLDSLPSAKIRPPRERQGAPPTVAGTGHMSSRGEVKAYEANLPPNVRHRLRMQRARESDEEPFPAKSG
jgi:hypothetical protein